MDYHALLKLRRNPHYKMNEKQLAKLAEYERDPMVMFGIVETHPNTFNTHKTRVKKVISK